MTEYVSQREFARRMGCSHVWINQLIREGKIPVNEKKRIPFEAGREAYEASKQPGYDAQREHGKRQREAAKKGAAKTTKTRKTSKSTEDAPLPEPPLDAASAATVSQVNVAYNKARLAEKTYQAKLKEIEFKKAQKQLIPIEEVQEDAERLATEIREKLSSVAPRIANICEGRSAREIEGIIDDAINDALGALQKSKFKKG